MYSYNIFGSDPGEIDYQHSGERIGRRIRKIREDLIPKMSQGDLGAYVGLNANRIQQYENGARTPKIDLLKKIAGALGVQTMALIDPVVATYYGLMYAFFEMEELYGLQLKEIDGQIYLHFGDGSLSSGTNRINRDLRSWYAEQKEIIARFDAATTDEERDLIEYDYKMWKKNFPLSLTGDSSKARRKARLDWQIKELQKRRKELDEEDGSK